MIALLVTFIIVLAIMAISYMIISKIPIPPNWRWVIDVMFGLICLLVILEVVFGGCRVPLIVH